MLGINDLELFIVAGLLLNFTPGVDMLYVMQRATQQGTKAGFVAALGIGGGCMIHILFAVAGLSVLLAASSAAFTAVKFAGAAYLIYLGLKLIFQPQPSASNPITHKPEGLTTVFKQGVLINVLNPKIALFFLAFIPQFIDSNSPDKMAAFLVLGLIFNFNGTLVNTWVAWLTVCAKTRLKAATYSGRVISTVVGTGFILLGAKLALQQR